MSEKKSNTTARYRNYATVVYPDSAPENWQDIIAELKIPVFISPLHDKDKNANGEDKKPHYHVEILFDSQKTKAQAEEVIKSFGYQTVSPHDNVAFCPLRLRSCPCHATEI